MSRKIFDDEHEMFRDSVRNFLQKEIEPHLKNVFPAGNSKGAAFSEYQIELPEKFTQKYIYFKHLSRQ